MLNCQVLTEKLPQKNQNIYLLKISCLFQAVYRYFKMIVGVGNGTYIYYLKSKGLSEKRINSIKTPNHSITPNLNYLHCL